MESPEKNLQEIQEVENEENLTQTNEGNKKCVFISGIPYTTTEEELREKFQTCGIIREIKMPKYQDTGRNIGYAHIYFKKNKAVQKVKNYFNILALELNKSYIGNRYLTVTMADGGNTLKSKNYF
jgi:nucleolin